MGTCAYCGCTLGTGLRYCPDGDIKGCLARFGDKVLFFTPVPNSWRMELQPKRQRGSW